MEAPTVERHQAERPWETAAAASYHTFPRKLAPALTAAGGLLAVLGGAGTWIRATSLVPGGLSPEQVAVVAGYEQVAGRVLIGAGVIAVAGALAWLASDPPLRAIPALATVVIVVIAVAQLIALDGRAARMTEQAGADPQFASYHAAFGWGAWVLLLAAVTLFLGALVGLLREIDLRTLGREVDR